MPVSFPTVTRRAACLLATGLLPLLGCRKERMLPLPEATQVGANTFGCRLNGQAWIPNGFQKMSGEVIKISADYGASGPKQYQFCLGAYRRGTIHDEIELTVHRLDHVGTYPLQTTYRPSQPWSAGGWYQNLPSNPHTVFTTYRTDSLRTGTLTITRLDTAVHIISGTFSFTAITDSTQQTVALTDGRFDVRYDPY